MRRAISRNIAIVTAIFMVTFSIMLVTNYFQISRSETIHSEVIEKLKLANEDNSNNPLLQEQIRTLDLLARKAYFIGLNRVKAGVAILLVMVVLFVVSLQIYFAKSKEIPNKEIDPIDDWVIKSKTRKYLLSVAGGVAFGGVLFAMLTAPHFKEKGNEERSNKTFTERTPSDFLIPLDVDTDSNKEIPSIEPVQPDLEAVAPTNSAITAPPTHIAEVPKVSHNAFRGDRSLGISAATKIPTSWDITSGKNILWSVQVPRKGYNSPIINGNKIFFSGADEEDRELFCYELSSGKELWRLSAKDITGSRVPATTDDTGLAASTVATNGKQVCAIFATGDLLCADMDGKLLWAKNMGVPDNHYGYASSLLIYENLLIIQYDNNNAKQVLALDVATGNERWAKTRAERNPSWSSPVIVTGNHAPQLILIGNPGITSYNPTTGALYWRVEAMSGEPAPSPAYANGIVFAGTEYAALVAIDVIDGAILWRSNEFLPEIASPLAIKDFVLVATSYGVVASYDAKTGKIIKTMEFDTDFNASPIMVEGKIYLVCRYGKVFILSAEGNFEVIHSFDMGEPTYATPAFSDKKIVLKTDNRIYCIGE